jgi:hypothetical protein
MTEYGVRLDCTSGFFPQECESRRSGDQTTRLYTTSALVIFLCLPALYASRSIPSG